MKLHSSAGTEVTVRAVPVSNEARILSFKRPFGIDIKGSQALSTAAIDET